MLAAWHLRDTKYSFYHHYDCSQNQVHILTVTAPSVHSRDKISLYRIMLHEAIIPDHAY